MFLLNIFFSRRCKASQSAQKVHYRNLALAYAAFFLPRLETETTHVDGRFVSILAQTPPSETIHGSDTRYSCFGAASLTAAASGIGAHLGVASITFLAPLFD
jgi:hypothetical protein